MNRRFLSAAVIAALVLAVCVLLCSCGIFGREPTVTGIEIVAEPGKVDYYTDDEFSLEGLVVKTVYSDGSYGEVIPMGELSVNAPSALVPGEHSISVGYNFGETSYTDEFVITVSEPPKTDTTSVSLPGIAGTLYVGQKLSDAILSGGEGSVEGTYAWTNPDTVISAVSGEYPLTFTPSDTVQYNTHTASITVKAKQLSVAVFASGEGSASPSGTINVNYGASQTVTFTPSSGYYVYSLSVDGKVVSAADRYSFTNITADHSISVSFMVEGYTKGAQSVTNITDLSKTCNGKPVSSPSYSRLGDGTVTITYYRIHANGSVAELSGAPSAVGNYKVRVSVAEGTDYLAGYGEKRFSIKLTVNQTLAKCSSMSSSVSVAPLSSADISEINSKLRIAYFHTSHGNQINEGMDLIKAHLNTNYVLSGSTIYDNYLEGGAGNYKDAGNIASNWGSTVYAATKAYLDANTNTNVVIWAWCGQLCFMSTAEVQRYLDDMTQLERDYPNVYFVYMTGHAYNADYGLGGSLGTNTANNAKIRNYCLNNNKILFDFEMMDCYDPAGSYFGARNIRDDCCYDKDGSFDGNWADEWASAEYAAGRISETHRDYYSTVGSNHTKYLNSVCKAYAFWNMLHLLCS